MTPAEDSAIRLELLRHRYDETDFWTTGTAGCLGLKCVVRPRGR